MTSLFRTCLVLLIIVFSSALPSTSALARDVPDGFAELAEKLSPAVVNISTSQNVDISDDVPAFPKGSPLERFNDFFERRNRSGRVAQSLGSGFVIDPEGYIVTNNHVIEGSDFIEVVFPNEDSYEAELLGRDPSTDIALLKIKAGKPLPYVSWGDSENAQVGDWVMAIGNPFGYGGSVTAGIISARNRQINHGNYDDFIQTDVAINKGNSGGPLFNMDGDVVGVNTAIVSPTGGSVGISFSVPADLAKSVVKQLQEYGETRRGSIGIRVQAVDRNLADSYGLDEPKGAIVTNIVSDSPAEKAGLKIGDLILKVGSHNIDNQRVLYRVVAESEIGKAADVVVIRKRKLKTLSITPERLKEKVTKVELSGQDGADGGVDSVAMGISVEGLTQDVRRTYKIKSETKGVRVTKVASTSEAAGKIHPGDIIQEIAFEPVDSPQAFKEAVENAKAYESPVTILVYRSGNYVFYSMHVS